MRKTLTKPVVSLLSFLFVGNFCTHAQVSIIAEFTNHPLCDTAIIRNWKDNLSIVYSKSASRGNCFYLIDQTSGMVVQSARTDNDVKDMEIDSDTVYYCGVNNGGGPILGFFSVYDMLTTTLQDNTVPINFHNYFMDNVSKIIPKRIEAFHVSDGIHAIVLVDAKFTSDSVKKILVDIYKGNSMNSWVIWAGCYAPFGETSNIFYGDDIAVTDNYVFLVGHKRFSAGIYMRKFKKPTCCFCGVNDNIFYPLVGSNIYDVIYTYAPTFGGNINILGDSFGEHSVYCTHTEGDNVAITCMASYYDGTSFTYGTSVKCFDVSALNISIVTPTNEVFHPYTTVYNRTWDVRDLRYDPQSHNIIMLHDMNNPIDGTFKSIVTTIDYPALSTSIMTWPISGGSQRWSVDKSDGLPNGISTVGRGGVGVPKLSRNQTYVKNCFSVHFPKQMMWGGRITDFEVMMDKYPAQSSSSLTLIPVSPEPVEIICSE